MDIQRQAQAKTLIIQFHLHLSTNKQWLTVVYSYSFGETSCGRPQSAPKSVLRVTTLGHPQDDNFEPLVHMHFRCIIFSFISPTMCLKHYNELAVL